MPYTGPERKRVRADWHDYRRPRSYFVTLVCHHHTCLWGCITARHMRLGPGGEMVTTALQEVLARYPGITIEPWVVMPNHLHAIITLPNPNSANHPSLSDIMGWFKTVTTKRYIQCVRTHGWPPFDGHVWQGSFHDHIIRDEDEYVAIANYIEANPLRWHEDRYHEPDTFAHMAPSNEVRDPVGKP